MGKGKKTQHEKGSSSKLNNDQNRSKATTDGPAAMVGSGSMQTAGKIPGNTVQHSEKNKNKLNCNQQLESNSDYETESESISKSLGEEDTIEEQMGDCSSNAGSAETSAVPETAPSSNQEKGTRIPETKVKPTFASLFAGNRQASNGSKLQQMDTGEGPVQILATDLDEVQDEWNHCLVGYFVGRFPGKLALQQLTATWKVKVTIHFHNSGWIIFKCDNEESQLKVLQEGPYMVFGRPLLLKTMPKFFKFDNEELSKFPVWIQLRNLPLELWSNTALSKMCSKIGKPVYADQLTSCKARVSFARALVEIDVSKEVMKHIDLMLPNGEQMTQEVYYENIPHFCSHCKRVGHSFDVCKNKERNMNKERNETQVPKVNKEAETQKIDTTAAGRMISKPVNSAGNAKDRQTIQAQASTVEVQQAPSSVQQDDCSTILAEETGNQQMDNSNQHKTLAKTWTANLQRDQTRNESPEQNVEEPANDTLEMLTEIQAEPGTAVTSNQLQAGKHKTKHKSRKKEKEQPPVGCSARMEGDSSKNHSQ